MLRRSVEVARYTTIPPASAPAVPKSAAPISRVTVCGRGKWHRSNSAWGTVGGEEDDWRTAVGEVEKLPIATNVRSNWRIRPNGTTAQKTSFAEPERLCARLIRMWRTSVTIHAPHPGPCPAAKTRNSLTCRSHHGT